MTTALMSSLSDEQFSAALHDAHVELNRHQPALDAASKLTQAGAFVARFGALGDLYDEPDLNRMKSFATSGSAWDLLAHWSIQRNDGGSGGIPEEFTDWHLDSCKVCDYLESVLGIIDIFTHENCNHCGRDLDSHDVEPGQDGSAVARCHPTWRLVEPHPASDGVVAEYQLSDDAFSARWVGRLTDGTWALVTRTYYLGELDEDSAPIEGVLLGEVFVERQDEYLVCSNPTDPGGTEIGSMNYYMIVESGNPAGEDPESLARAAFEPAPAEWQENAPAGFPPLVEVFEE